MLLVLQGSGENAIPPVPVLRLSPPLQEGGRVAVVCHHDTVAADLTVTIILTQGVAQIIGAILISGGVLPGSSGADHIVAGHSSFRLVCLSIAPIRAIHKGGCATLSAGTRAADQFVILTHGDNQWI